ncbi:unnamed protein product, partial [Rotaria sp. Silwood2]
CMADTLKNLINFNFYIVSKCQLLLDNIQIIEESFKKHTFFLDHQWINVKCSFDQIMSYQHLSTIGIIKPKLFDGIINYRNIFDWKYVKYLNVNLNSSIDLFLGKFNIIFPHITCIKYDMGKDFLYCE